jgi:AraC-like DNA-binding protein
MAASSDTIDHGADVGFLDMAVAAPHPALRPYVLEYVGAREGYTAGLIRRELPGDLAPIIFNFGPPFRMRADGDAQWIELTSFVAGAFDSSVLVAATGAYEVVQVNFTLLGLRAIVGRPIADLTNRMVSLADVFGAEGERLAARLYDLGTWPARFAALDQLLLARLQRSRAIPPIVAATYRDLVRTAGAARITDIAEAAGCSRKHLIAQFASEIGLTPKVFARVLRFGRAAELLKAADGGRLVDIALACGYYDQSHFNRDFKAFAGVTPAALMASRLPERGGFAERAG